MNLNRPRIQHGKSERGLRRRRSKHSVLIDHLLSMEPGDHVDLDIPRDRGTVAERRRITRIVERNVRDVLPEYLYRVRLTKDRKIRISCHDRLRRGRLSS